MNDTIRTTIGPRPAKISFAPECFEIVGERVSYVVTLSAPHYPRRFDDRAEAEDFARRTRRSVSVVRANIMRRVRW